MTKNGWCPDKTSFVSPPLNVPVHVLGSREEV